MPIETTSLGSLIRQQVYHGIMESLYESYAEDLQGTCTSAPDWEDWLKAHLEVYPGNKDQTLAAQVEYDEERCDAVVDELAPECVHCGWYGHEGEVLNSINDEPACDDCFEEHEFGEDDED